MTDHPTESAESAEATEAAPEKRPATTETVEEVVRRQLTSALGGRRGILEAAVPTIVFTILWLTTRELRLALVVSVAAALVLLAARLVQKTTIQFVLNALFGIGIGWVFVEVAASRGGSKDDQALAYFLPGLLYNGGYFLLMALTCLIGWPLVGFLVGSVTGDPTEWHSDKGIVRLCSRLTWLLAVPCFLRVAIEGPIWLAGHSGGMDADTAVAALGVLKIALGWPLQLAALAGMLWLLGRNKTPAVAATA